MSGEAPPERRLLPEAALAFGGRTIRFRAADPALRFAVRAPHTSFLVDPSAEPDLDVACSLGDPAPSALPVAFDSGGTWELRRLPDGGEEVTFHAATETGGREPLIRLTLDAALSRAEVVHAPLPGGGHVVPIGFPLDEYLAARLLARSGAVILHACALVRQGEALVFTGHSGAGKSTMAALGEGSGARVLSDDRTILVPGADGVEAWGTPWHGSYTRGLPERAPVRGIFLLVKGAAESAEPLAPARAFQEMLVRLVQPTVDRRELEAGMDAVERIAGAVGAWELRSRPVPAAYALARHVAAGSVAAS